MTPQLEDRASDATSRYLKVRFPEFHKFSSLSFLPLGSGASALRKATPLTLDDSWNGEGIE